MGLGAPAADCSRAAMLGGRTEAADELAVEVCAAGGLRAGRLATEGGGGVEVAVAVVAGGLEAAPREASSCCTFRACSRRLASP